MKYNFTLESLSPLSHGDVTSGIDNATNTRLFLRTDILSNERIIKAPTISENAVRTVLFRLPLHEHLLQFLDIEKSQLKQSVVNLLTSGGNLKKGAREPSSANALGHKVKSLYPSLDLLGGAVDDFIMPAGRQKVLSYPVAIEYKRQLKALNCTIEPKESIYDLIAVETKNRGISSDAKGNQMLYSYEVMITGSRFFNEITLDRNTPSVSMSALLMGLNEWDGYFGGQGGKGKGRMMLIDSNLPPVDLYLEHLEKNKDAMRQGLLSGDFGTGTILCSD